MSRRAPARARATRPASTDWWASYFDAQYLLEYEPIFQLEKDRQEAGRLLDLLGDVAHRIPPLTDVDVSDLISSVKAAPMLHGHRGAAVRPTSFFFGFGLKSIANSGLPIRGKSGRANH